MPRPPAGAYLIVLGALAACGRQPCPETEGPVVRLDQAYATCNARPVATLMMPPTAGKRSIVKLDGSRSADPAGDALTFAWSAIGPKGETVSVRDATEAKASLEVVAEGLYDVTLVVSDGELEDSATATLEVRNRAPVADVGSDRTSPTGITFTVDGQASQDPDGDTLTYAWTLVERPTASLVALSDPRTPAQTITPDVDGVYAFSLVVSDGVATSAPAVVRVGVGFRGSPPVASAGPDLEVLPGLDVELDGTGSADSDGDPLTYQWRVLHATGGQANLANATLPRAQLVQPVAGVYTIELTVNDGFFNATDTAVVTVAMDPTGVVIGVESCTTGGNILVLNGDRDPDFTDDIHLPHDYIHPGLGVYTSGGWTASALAYTSTTGAPKFVQVNVTTTSDWWSTEFSTTNLDQALVTGSYPAAMRFPFEDLGHPGLGIYGDGRGCNRLIGEFEIHELETSTTADPAVHTVERFTATFTQHCEEGVAKLTGCIHYQR